MDKEQLTTGQKLLAALHSSEAARTERYAGTVQAKMKEARDRLNTLGFAPKHPIKSDLAIFGHAQTEVHRLLADAADKEVCTSGGMAPSGTSSCNQ